MPTECMNECEASKYPMGLVMKIISIYRMRRCNTMVQGQTACREGCLAIARVLMSLNWTLCPIFLSSLALQPEQAVGVQLCGSLTGNWRLQPTSSTCPNGVVVHSFQPLDSEGHWFKAVLSSAGYFDSQLELSSYKLGTKMRSRLSARGQWPGGGT